MFGIVVALLGFVVLIRTVYYKLFVGTAIGGYPSLMCTLLILGGSILFSLGMIGEYIGRIYISINNSPQYVVREVYNFRKE